MRELCVEEIAMSTRVALPMFMGCCRMSELRRQLLPSPPPSQDRTARVRKNLFGPIDHEENIKFVQDELNKISQADCKRWNFDFEAEKPKEGRYDWEPVGEAVPQAYEMSRLTALTTHATTTAHTTLAAPKPVHKTVPECSSSSKSEQQQQQQQQQPSTSSTPTAALDAPPTPTSSTPKLPSAAGSSKASQSIRKAVKLDRREGTRKKAIETTRITRNSSQPSVTEYMRISKRKRSAATSKLEEDPPPALVKRTKTTSS